MCGGAIIDTARGHRREGLSPRVRGSLCQALIWVVSSRSIPAGAGEPRLMPNETGVKGVYPRGCGGAEGDTTTQEPGGGLSPRVRGSPIIQPAPTSLSRSIPAGAGEPDSSARRVG